MGELERPPDGAAVASAESPRRLFSRFAHCAYGALGDDVGAAWPGPAALGRSSVETFVTTPGAF